MYIKQVELTRFKSFGSATAVPLLPGFTVVSGPNGSGKSNILDALLFCLGLSSSKGMRADKLLDLVHSGSLDNNRKRVETSVAVTFELSSDPAQSQEWKVSRRLRVNQSKTEPTYTSTFYINDLPCTLTELHEQLEAMHVYPNGYNVVLQGDVTRIISMNGKERRQIIDELAGVANFDRKIAQAKTKLDDVQEQIERFRLIEEELKAQSERLLQESQKAQRYQALREQLNHLEIVQQVLTWRHLDQQAKEARQGIAEHKKQQEESDQKLKELATQLAAEEQALTELQTQIHALGEDDYLQMQSQIATWQAQQDQQRQQIDSWTQERDTCGENITQASQQGEQLQQERQQIQDQQTSLDQHHQDLQHQHQQQQAALSRSREQVQALAQSSDAWIKQQRYLSRQLEETRQEHGPLEQEQIRLGERLAQMDRQEDGLTQEIAQLRTEVSELEDPDGSLETQAQEAEQRVQAQALELAELQQAIEVDQATSQRLQNERHTKQRQLDKLETRRQVLQDTQGSRATQVILSSKLDGICGLVAQLGQVEPRYQLALEIAAGSRLNYVVVEEDEVAAKAIQLLKREKAGRATLLPLSKLRPIRPPGPIQLPGVIDYAIRLVEFEDRYRDVFGFVLGQTLVFQTLEQARAHLGRHRMVTLDGELLEASGAMTGGSKPNASSLRFSASDSAEVDDLNQRLQDIDDLLAALNPRLRDAQAREKALSQEITQARQAAHQAQQRRDQHQSTLETKRSRLDQLLQQQQQIQTERVQAEQRQEQISAQLTPLRQRLEDLNTKLGQLEHSPVNQHWQQAQTTVQNQEEILTQTTTQIRDLEQQQHALRSQLELSQVRQQQLQDRIQEWQQRQETLTQQIEAQQVQITERQTQIDQMQAQIQEVEGRLSDLRARRDQQEFQVRSKQQQQQRWEWDRYNAQTQQQEKEALLAQLQDQLQQAHAQLPDPLPEVEPDLTLDDLQRRRKRTEDQLKALEPVNMLAITEYEASQQRLEELTQKLETLNQERTELLLRIENFSTLRRQAFMEAFLAVDQHFQSIFAQLSDGDGHLQLEDPEDPFAGGLTLVAHPKGKPVRRLSSMSGGEKSLTALSFIFALQRYRPSSFYAFDEVDMFLDGANVEKLARMVAHQAQEAQFIVVSLRRPMIEKAERTIGVTQARGAYTQVIGLKNRPSSDPAPRSKAAT